MNFFKINVITFYTNEWNICVLKEENENILLNKLAVKITENIIWLSLDKNWNHQDIKKFFFYKHGR